MPSMKKYNAMIWIIFTIIVTLQNLPHILGVHIPLVSDIPYLVFNVFYVFLDIYFFYRIVKRFHNRIRIYQRRKIFFKEVLQYA